MPSYTDVYVGRRVAHEALTLDQEARDRVDSTLEAVYAGLADLGASWREADVSSGGSWAFRPDWMGLLQRSYALVVEGRPVTSIAVAPEPDATELFEVDYDREELQADMDGIVLDLALGSDSHLAGHDASSGCYVPLRFPDFTSDDGVIYIDDHQVGSSHTLLAELRTVAPAIGVFLEPDGSLSAGERKTVGRTPLTHPFVLERDVWLTLHEACRCSIDDDLMVLFF